MIFGQLVCRGCCKILTYPFTAISCACRNCGTVNAAQYLRVSCPCCNQSILLPINALTFLCPLCATITDIPEELLPPIEDPVDLNGAEGSGFGIRGDGRYGAANTIYVSHPSLRSSDTVGDTNSGNGENRDGSGTSNQGNGEDAKAKAREERRAALQRAKEKEQNLRLQLLHKARTVGGAGGGADGTESATLTNYTRRDRRRADRNNTYNNSGDSHTGPDALAGGRRRRGVPAHGHRHRHGATTSHDSATLQSNRVQWGSEAAPEEDEEDEEEGDAIGEHEKEGGEEGDRSGSDPQTREEREAAGGGALTRAGGVTVARKAGVRESGERERVSRATVVIATRIL